MLIFCDHHCV